jgi:hypothetical protein
VSRLAEAEALAHLHRYRGYGGLALIKALERRRLGIPTTDRDAELIRNAEAAGFQVEWSAADVSRAREEAMGGGSGGGSTSSPTTATTVTTSSARGGSSNASGDSGAALTDDLADEASSLLTLLVSLVEGAGKPLTLGELSAGLAEQTGASWGSHWELRHGPLLHFLRARASPPGGGGYLVLTRNKYLGLEGMPVPAPPTPTAAAAPLSTTTTTTSSFGALHALARPGGGVPNMHDLDSSVPPMLQRSTTAPGGGAVWQSSSSSSSHHPHSASSSLADGPMAAMTTTSTTAASRRHSLSYPSDPFFDPWAADAGAAAATTAAASAARAKVEAEAEALRAEAEAEAASRLAMEARRRASEAVDASASHEMTLARIRGELEVDRAREREGRREQELRDAALARRIAEEEHAGLAMRQRTMMTTTTMAAAMTAARPSAAAYPLPYAAAPGPSQAYPPAALLPPPQYALATYGPRHASTTSSTMMSTQMQQQQQQQQQYHHQQRSSSSVASYASTSSAAFPSPPTSTTFALGPYGDLVPTPHLPSSSLDIEAFAQTTVSRGACDDGGGDGDGDAGLTAADFDVLFRPMLVHGFTLVKHGRQGPPKKRRFWMSHRLTRLYWDSSKVSEVVLGTGERCIEMSEVVQIVDGVGTDLLRRRVGRGEVLASQQGRFFSLVTKDRTFDLEAASVAQRKVLVRAFAFLLNQQRAYSGGGGGGGGMQRVLRGDM